MSTHREPGSRRAAMLVSAALAIVIALFAFGPAVLAREPAPDASSGATQGRLNRSLSVTHGPIVTTLTTAGSDGHQLGDLRVVSLPLDAEAGSTGEAGRIDASLLTTGIDQPAPGDEIRISTLVFTLGDAADQLVVTGSGLYPAAGSTIAIDSVIVRPIVGGSGRFAGMSGWAESEHLTDDSWRHTLHLTSPGAVNVRVERPGLRRGQRADRDVPRRPTGPSREPGVIRTPLGSTDPAAAEGETLGLWHYLIPAGAALAPHTHPGDQVARIVRGVLAYQVVSGEARVLRADGSTETVGAGEVVDLEPGDTVIEPAGMVHFGTNAGRRPVEIISATLFETGAEPATVVEAPTASVAPMASAPAVETAAP